MAQDNVHTNIAMVSLDTSPLLALYQSVQRVYAPLLLRYAAPCIA
jgi:hypothetical protein